VAEKPEDLSKLVKEGFAGVHARFDTLIKEGFAGVHARFDALNDGLLFVARKVLAPEEVRELRGILDRAHAAAKR
jgi:hypothetical protein